MTTFDFNDGSGPVPAHQHVSSDGRLGGWVADTAKVEPTCFVGLKALVYGNARITGIAQVFGDARVSGNAKIFGCARVFGFARVSEFAMVSESTQVYGYAWVYGKSWVYGNTRVYENAMVHGDARVYGDAHLRGTYRISSGTLTSGIWTSNIPEAPVATQTQQYPIHTISVEVPALSLLGINPHTHKVIVDQGESWVRRNLREWPYGKNLVLKTSQQGNTITYSWYWES